MKTKLLSALAAVVMTAVASALSIDPALDPRNLGLIDPNHPANETESAGFINTLLDQPLNSGPTTIGANAYTRTGNNPAGGNYPDANGLTAVTTQTIALSISNGIVTVPFNGINYLYLLVKYDGPNYGSVIWWVDGLNSATVPSTAGGYGISHLTLFNPGDGPPPPPPPPPPPVGVPDGGSTALLLGFSMLAIGILNRRALMATALA